MQNIEFEVGLMFTDVKILKNVIVDDVVEYKMEIWLKK